MKVNKKIAALFAAFALIGAVSVPAASGVPPKAKCNSGQGNGSETEPANDCDPGNSGGHNQGGD